MNKAEDCYSLARNAVKRPDWWKAPRHVTGRVDKVDQVTLINENIFSENPNPKLTLIRSPPPDSIEKINSIKSPWKRQRRVSFNLPGNHINQDSTE